MLDDCGISGAAAGGGFLNPRDFPEAQNHAAIMQRKAEKISHPRSHATVNKRIHYHNDSLQ